MGKKITTGDRDRAYRVLMYGLDEENKICHLSKEEYAKRRKEIFEDCYGKRKAKRGK